MDCPLTYHDTWGYWDGDDTPTQVVFFTMQVEWGEYFYYLRPGGLLNGPFRSVDEAYDDARGVLVR